MAEEALKARHGITLRADPGVLLTVADRPLPLTGLRAFRRAIVHISQEANLALDAGDEVRFLLDTAYGAGPFVDSTANTAQALPGGDIAGIIPNAIATLNTTNGAVFVVGDIIRLGTEQLLVTAIATNVLTVRRGQNGTGVQAHITALDIFTQDVDWVTVAVILYDNADNASAPSAVVVIGNTGIVPIIVDDLDVALADNTFLLVPLGDRLRLRTTIVLTPSYQYSARVSLQN